MLPDPTLSLATPPDDRTQARGGSPSTVDRDKTSQRTIDHTPAAAPNADAPPGYAIESELGRGGMGVVYKARQIGLNRTVALKMILSGAHATQRDMTRFLAEAEAVAAIKHPNVVQVYDIGNHAGRPYMALEYCDGGALTPWLKDRGKLPPHEAAELLEQIARGVAAAHDQGIVHRDLKPGNILLAPQPKVADFGLAKMSGSDDLTRTGAVMGTPAYMAPEQAKGDTKFVGPTADVYALGAMLFECLTGCPPFQGSVAEVLRKVAEDEPPTVRSLVPGTPRDLALICEKCLAKAPHERYATAGELADELKRFAAGEPVSVRSIGVVEKAAKWARRKPTRAAAYALTLAVVVLAGFGLALAVLLQDALTARVQAEVARDHLDDEKKETEKSRDVAEQARSGEVVARNEAEAARNVAVVAKDELAKAQEKLERVEYGRTMQVAHQEWRENNIAAALALLDSTRKDLRGWEWQYVHRLCHADLLTLKGHTESVYSASFSADGSRIVTASGDKTAKVWDARTGAEILTLNGHTNFVRSASFSADGSRIVTGSWDQTAKVWDAKTGAEVLTLKGHTGYVHSASFSADESRIVTGSYDKTAKVWDAKTGAEVLTLKGHTAYVYSASFSADGSRLVTGSYDKTAKVWDAKNGAEVLTLKGHSAYVSSASFSPDGSRIVTGSFDQTAKVWDAKTGAEVLTLKGHINFVTSASFRTDGSRIVTGSWDQTAKVWDATTGADLLTLKGHTGVVNTASFSPDGSRVVTGSDDKTAKVWDSRPINREFLPKEPSVQP